MTGFLDSALCLGEKWSPFSLGIRLDSETECSELLPLKVLVVDDERLLADTTVSILRRAGFLGNAVYHGFGALRMAKSFRPDCLLTDIMMPGMNGVELAITITRRYPDTKILLFSGPAGISQILEESREQGYEFPILAKPVHPARLIAELRALGRE